MRITPLDVQQKKFAIKFRGFDVQEVDNFLEQLADMFESYLRDNKKLRARIERLKVESLGYKKREETFKRAILNSQKVMEEMKANARKSAELVVAEAEIKAEKILNNAHNRLAQLHEDIAELKRQRMQIEIQLRSVIEAHSKLLDIGQEEAKSQDESDSKVKLLNRS